MLTKAEKWKLQQEELKKKKAHTWYKFKQLPWLVCVPGCGLVKLNNKVSQKAAKAKCPGWD